ncbi:(2Fe-2S)-binding protein [Vibrio sp. SS-MA-C1-2]|uniref:(2Fe-2S)-binding protein n=1 Tax=Vibrio sp. SS-MA-C1-2 TaxID=2908646 RepID=UPI001F1CE8DC|nr:(2Fe-2S)-binding protein [Vibrio sp. SS-MA-C1-2]UJF18464.1 (2Fe-2S)-binding protein [Vibrio sp. SS-MA-C1-2]
MSFIKLVQQTKIEINVDEQIYLVNENQSLAAALLEVKLFRSSAHILKGRRVAPYCLMGVCYSCLVDIDGKKNQRSCMLPVKSGMMIKTGDQYDQAV